MRYISQIPNLRIYRNDGTVAYEFERGELIVGDPTLNTAGNIIDAAPIVSNVPGSVQFLFPTAATDIEKAGLGKLFWAAPPIATGAGTVVAGKKYQVLKGSVTYNTVAYNQREDFTAVTGVLATSGTGTFALAVQPEYDKPKPDQFYNEHFKLAHLMTGTEASFKIQGPEVAA